MTENNKTTLETIHSISEQLERVQSYIDSVREGKAIYWTNPITGQSKLATNDDHLDYIQDCILNISIDVDTVKKSIC
ncbi:MAG: hypothetical protein Q4B95_03360 [Lonepinella koalarum]|nr:hypothetical protein [Lonepinella koalarum]